MSSFVVAPHAVSRIYNHSVRACAILYCTYLEIFAPEDNVLRDSCSHHHFVSIGDCGFILLAIVFRLSLCDGNPLPIYPAIVIRLVFRDDDAFVFCLRSMVIRLTFRGCDSLFFRHTIVTCLHGCNMFVLRFAIVIRFSPDNHNLLILYLAIVILFSSCNYDLLLLYLAIVIRFSSVIVFCWTGLLILLLIVVFLLHLPYIKV